MYQKITPELIRECTDALEFYDNNGKFPWEKKKLTVTLSHSVIQKLKGKNKSQTIEKALSYVR